MRIFFILLTTLGLATSTYAQMGKRFEDSPFKDKYTDVREYEQMGLRLKEGRLYDASTGLMITHVFLNGRLARVAFIRPDGEWSEESAKRLWAAVQVNDKIEQKKTLNDVTIYEGINGGFMALGKGDTKTCLIFESAELNEHTKKYISRAVDSKIMQQRKNSYTDAEDVRATFDRKKRNLESEDRSSYMTFNNGTSGRISPGGAVYDMYGQQKGWANSSGFINYNNGTCGRISEGGAVYNMYGQQTGWARRNNDSD